MNIEGFKNPLAGLANLQGVIIKDHTNDIPYSRSLEDWVAKKGVNVTMGWVGNETELIVTSDIPHPNQVRLSFTTNPSEMSMTWTTSEHHEKNVVRYGTSPNVDMLNFVAYSISHRYTFGNYTDPVPAETYTSGFIHEALLVNLDPGKKYYYQIESNGYNTTIGENYSFIASPSPGSSTPVKILHIGDVGIFGTSVMVTKGMMDRMKSNDFHSVIHCGDISYANKYRASGIKRLAWAKQEIWDTWGVMVEPITRNVPYMVTPGNHELDMFDSTMENNTIYSKRFIMPGNERYYSFAIGMVHFVSVSTDESIDEGSTQHVWLDRKLAYLNQNRDNWPWVVTFQHRPIYNSNWKHKVWKGRQFNVSSRYPNPEIRGWPDAYNDLLVKHSVDLVLNGHVHHYERTWPVKDNKTITDSYTDKKYPVHITCGHGGKDLYKVHRETDDNSITSYVNNYEHMDKPAYVAERNNSVWGHCELEFLDRTTVQHRMYVIGEDTPRVNVTITRSSSTVITLSKLLLLPALLLTLH